MTPAEHKRLVTKVGRLYTRLGRTDADDGPSRQKIMKDIHDIKLRIKAATMQDDYVTISEHAMLRVLERVFGIDLNKVREVVLGNGVEALINTFHNGQWKLPGYDLTVVVKDRVVVTVMDTHHRDEDD